jgi:hypothetical protein
MLRTLTQRLAIGGAYANLVGSILAMGLVVYGRRRREPG